MLVVVGGGHTVVVVDGRKMVVSDSALMVVTVVVVEVGVGGVLGTAGGHGWCQLFVVSHRDIFEKKSLFERKNYY
jgi:hypothetical protein